MPVDSKIVMTTIAQPAIKPNMLPGDIFTLQPFYKNTPAPIINIRLKYASIKKQGFSYINEKRRPFGPPF
jgi:hypothetical protein